MKQSLSGKTALVTGAGSRLGLALARTLFEHGCRMLLHCRSSRRGAETLAAEIKSTGGWARVISADLSKTAQVLKLARDAEKISGGIDILVNSAAIFWPTPLKKLSADELDAFYAVNLKAPFILSAEIGRMMKTRGARNPSRGGAILNMACLSGLKAWKTHLPYSISKAGVVSLTQGLAKMLAPEVRVNAIAPGTVLPPENMRPEAIESLRSRIPLDKIGSPADITDAAIYLLTAPFVTGQILAIDGGRSL